MDDVMECFMASVHGAVHGGHMGPLTDTRHLVARVMGAHGIFHVGSVCVHHESNHGVVYG